LTGTVRSGARVAAILISVLLFAAPASGAAAEWRQVTLPEGSGSWRLIDVAIGADGRGWSVGDYAGTRALVVREGDDGGWARSYLARASIGTTRLWAVTTTAHGTQVFAAGAFTEPEFHDRSLAVHWTGTRWERMGTVDRPGATDLYGIAARGAHDVWAVGSSSADGFTTTRTVIEHWDGTAWRLVHSPNPDDFQNELIHVAAGRDGSLFATGHTSTGTLVAHRVHGRWRTMVAPEPPRGFSSVFLEGLIVRNRDNVWLAGGGQRTSDGAERPLMAHWDGTRWTVHRLPTIDQSYLNDAVRTAGGLLGVGTTFTDYSSAGLTEEWDGAGWSATASPEALGYEAIAARAGRVIAVGAAAPRGGSVVEERTP
jgi:hypothetical protein